VGEGQATPALGVPSSAPPLHSHGGVCPFAAHPPRGQRKKKKNKEAKEAKKKKKIKSQQQHQERDMRKRSASPRVLTVEINVPRGRRGQQGSAGRQGERGLHGKDGARGFQGDQGTEGQRGAAGETGQRGQQGYQGAAGNIGFQGAQGRRGMQGECGAQGDVGRQGQQGARGQQGGRGLQGAQGEEGNGGAQGYQGLDGVSGSQGAQGQDGHQGSQGQRGGAGQQGRQGAQGQQGHQGASCIDGPQGYRGQIGAQGYQGAQGQRGFQGNCGWQGLQGYQGAPASVASSPLYFSHTLNAVSVPSTPAPALAWSAGFGSMNDGAIVGGVDVGNTTAAGRAYYFRLPRSGTLQNVYGSVQYMTASAAVDPADLSWLFQVWGASAPVSNTAPPVFSLSLPPLSFTTPYSTAGAFAALDVPGSLALNAGDYVACSMSVVANGGASVVLANVTVEGSVDFA
jgi:hypothetical protein